MAHHGRTPQTILDAPALTPVLEPVPEGIATRVNAKGELVAVGRHAVRVHDRAERFRRPKIVPPLRVRPERTLDYGSQLIRARRRAEAVVRRAEQKTRRDAEKASRTRAALAGAQ